ncbi:MAG: prepilin-type N-terminal cleavage/methylation domain-containing protein [Candidatus Omnitrophota bacterium]|nr:prepilin-type N-terminal cleavage/methylation domain-containing protein [bacterium]
MNKQGFTLIELLIGIILLAVVVLTAALISIMGVKFLVELNEIAELQREVNRAIYDITGEISKGRSYNLGAGTDTIYIYQDRYAQFALYAGGGVIINSTPDNYGDDVKITYSLAGSKINKQVDQLSGGVFSNLSTEDIAGTARVQINTLQFDDLMNCNNCVNVTVQGIVSGSNRELSYTTRVVLRGANYL